MPGLGGPPTYHVIVEQDIPAQGANVRPDNDCIGNAISQNTTHQAIHTAKVRRAQAR